MHCELFVSSNLWHVEQDCISLALNERAGGGRGPIYCNLPPILEGLHKMKCLMLK